jgi:hypothetical protein
MDKKLIFRALWGGYFVICAVLIVLGALEVIDFGMSALILPLIMILLAVAAYSAYKLFWFGLFVPIAIILQIFDAAYEWKVGGVAIVIFYVCAVVLGVGFTVLFHKSGTWKLKHQQTPTPYIQHDAGNAEKIANTENEHLSTKAH